MEKLLKYKYLFILLFFISLTINYKFNSNKVPDINTEYVTISRFTYPYKPDEPVSIVKSGTTEILRFSKYDYNQVKVNYNPIMKDYIQMPVLLNGNNNPIGYIDYLHSFGLYLNELKFYNKLGEPKFILSKNFEEGISPVSHLLTNEDGLKLGYFKKINGELNLFNNQGQMLAKSKRNNLETTITFSKILKLSNEDKFNYIQFLYILNEQELLEGK